MKYLTFLVLLLVFSSLSYKFPNNPSISDEKGNPVSDTTYYFPLELFIDSIRFANTTEIKQDTFSVRWFSQDLWLSEEPVLSNYYLNRDIYRLTWLRSFHPAIILRIENSDGEVILIEKEMTLNEPRKELEQVPGNELTEEEKEQMTKGAGSLPEYQIEKATIQSKVRKLTISDWTNFEHLLDELNFGSMPTTRAWEFGTDGSEWILEQHKEDKYHVVNRWTPGKRQYSTFRKLGDFLIDKSSYKNEKRY